MKKVSNKIKQKFIRWVATGLQSIGANEKEDEKLEQCFTRAPSTQIGPEGIVENFRGNPDCIEIGDNSYIRGSLLTHAHNGKIKIGDWCYIGVRTEIWSMESITIGNRVLISHGVNIHDGTAHSLDSIERHAHFKHILEKGHLKEEIPGVLSESIIIEDDVWINFGATILKGVRIGAGSIIGCGAVVTKDVPPGVLYHTKSTPFMRQL